MAKSRRGPGTAPGAPVPIRVECCPPELDRKACVRFLGQYSGTFTHYSRKGSIPCLGENGECPIAVHKYRKVWKGYAPAEWWRGAPYNDWCACVWEITESLNEVLDELTLRGTIWEVFRQIGETGKPEVTANPLRIDLESTLRPAFDPFPHVQRLYGYLPMQWGVKSHIPKRLRLEPAKDAPPPGFRPDEPGKSNKPDEVSPEERQRVRDMLAAYKRQGYKGTLANDPADNESKHNGKAVLS